MREGQKKRLSALARESTLKSALLDWAALQPDLILWRQNSGMARFPGKDGGKDRYVRMTGMSGCADFTGVVRGGRRLEIETKREGQALTEAQIKFATTMSMFDAIYIVASSLEDVIEQLKKAGVRVL